MYSIKVEFIIKSIHYLQFGKIIKKNINAIIINFFQSVVAVCSNGTFHRFSFNKEGLCERRAFDHILQLGSESDFWTAPF